MSVNERHDPDPHYPLEVARGVWSCAYGGCTQHTYPKSTLIVPTRFDGGKYGGSREMLEADALRPSLDRKGVEYRLNLLEDYKGLRSGRTTAIYQPVDDYTPDSERF